MKCALLIFLSNADTYSKIHLAHPHFRDFIFAYIFNIIFMTHCILLLVTFFVGMQSIHQQADFTCFYKLFTLVFALNSEKDLLS